MFGNWRGKPKQNKAERLNTGHILLPRVDVFPEDLR